MVAARKLVADGPTQAPDATPAALAALITANVDAMYADEISFEEFEATQKRLWNSIHARGEAFDAAVSKIIRGDKLPNMSTVSTLMHVIQGKPGGFAYEIPPKPGAPLAKSDKPFTLLAVCSHLAALLHLRAMESAENRRSFPGGTVLPKLKYGGAAIFSKSGRLVGINISETRSRKTVTGCNRNDGHSLGCMAWPSGSRKPTFADGVIAEVQRLVREFGELNPTWFRDLPDICEEKWFAAAGKKLKAQRKGRSARKGA